MLPASLTKATNHDAKKPRGQSHPTPPDPRAPPTKARVTQKEVARKAKVSHMTVSLALRDDPRIAQKTRVRIQKIARLLGYAPDPMLTALSTYRKRQRPAAYQANIAWLSDWLRRGSADGGDFALYHDGAASRARELGYTLDEISLTGENKNSRTLRRLLNARNITGLLLAPSAEDAGVLDFDFSRYSAVRLGYSYRSLLLNTVANSQFRTALTTMQKVLALGYRRVGVLLNKRVDERTSWHFLGGYLAGQHDLPPGDRLAPFYMSYTIPRESQEEGVYRWITEEKIDCLIGASHVELYRSLIRRGLDIPGQLGYADVQIAEGDDLFSGLHQNAREIGRAAVDLVVGMMHHHTIGMPHIPHHVLVEGSWREGKTAIPRR